MKVLIFVFFILSCSQKKHAANEKLIKLIIPIQRSPIYLFSYPGREVHESKKRYVLDYLLNKIENSTHLIEVYAYSFNHPEIIEALKKARDRGVKITFLLDPEKNYKELTENNFEYRIWKGSGLHHIKAILFDKNSIFFGTGNFSKLGLTHDWNGYIDLPLEPYEYTSLQAELEIKKSDFLIKVSNFQFLFSPQNGHLIQDKILYEIEKSKEKVQILSFDHYDPILSHVLKKASARGVQVEIVQNKPLDEEGKYLTRELFFGNSIVYEDGNTDRVFQEDSNFPEAGLLHHKTILIDNKILMTGSYNFSLSARDKNRELFVFTLEQKAIEEFTKEFERIRSKSYPQVMKFLNHKYEKKIGFQVSEFPKSCFTQEAPSGIWEVGEKLFFSYIYFSKSSPCFDFSNRADISSNLASFSMKPKEMQNLWEIKSFYPRFGNEKYSENENEIQLQQTSWEFIKIFEQPLFSYKLEFKNNIQNLKIYIPDYGFVEQVQNIENNKFTFSIQKKISELLVLWEEDNKPFFFCIQKEKPSKKLEFLLGRLFLNSIYNKREECGQLINNSE